MFAKNKQETKKLKGDDDTLLPNPPYCRLRKWIIEYNIFYTNMPFYLKQIHETNAILFC